MFSRLKIILVLLLFILVTFMLLKVISLLHLHLYNNTAETGDINHNKINITVTLIKTDRKKQRITTVRLGAFFNFRHHIFCT